MGRPSAVILAFLLVLAGCGAEEPPSPQATGGAASGGRPETPDDLPRGIMLALAQFVTETGPDGKPVQKPGPARLELLFRAGGEWQTRAIEDPESNVFHKAMVYAPPGGAPALLTLGGSAAAVKLWVREGGALVPKTLWSQDFGGKFSRMRDVEAADLFGEGSLDLAVATHDQGVVVVLRPQPDGRFEVTELDRQADTFVHEIEIGDLDGDGVPEVYATPSAPNKLDGTPQPGTVVRYVPAKGEPRAVVADLGMRHAKEILVGDVDGDGRDELYVSVEGEVEPGTRKLKSEVEIRRYDADTPPAKGAVIATLPDRLSRFLTAGDVDGDGRREMVAAAFSSGLWLLRPGDDPTQPWRKLLIDRDSAGFEHAAILTDLDGDGLDELYVASDKHKELRRYVWNGQRLEREVIYRRPDARPIFTWNLMPVPLALIPE